MAAGINHRMLGGLKTAECHSVPVPGVTFQDEGVGRGRRGVSPRLPSQLLAVVGNFWHPLTHGHITPVSALSPSDLLSVSSFFLLKKSPGIG